MDKDVCRVASICAAFLPLTIFFPPWTLTKVTLPPPSSWAARLSLPRRLRVPRLVPPGRYQNQQNRRKNAPRCINQTPDYPYYNKRIIFSGTAPDISNMYSPLSNTRAWKQNKQTPYVRTTCQRPTHAAYRRTHTNLTTAATSILLPEFLHV